VAEVVAEYGENPDEGPTVGMQLSRGHVNFSEKLPLKTGEGETFPDAFEYGLVEKEEGFPIVGAVIDTNRFPRCARVNKDVGIMFSPNALPLKSGSLSR